MPQNVHLSRVSGSLKVKWWELWTPGSLRGALCVSVSADCTLRCITWVLLDPAGPEGLVLPRVQGEGEGAIVLPRVQGALRSWPGQRGELVPHY